MGNHRYLAASLNLDRMALDIADAGLCTESTARKVLERARDLTVQALSRGERVHWRGLGTFRLTERVARKQDTPLGHVDVPRRASVAYRPAKYLRHLAVVRPCELDECPLL